MEVARSSRNLLHLSSALSCLIFSSIFGQPPQLAYTKNLREVYLPGSERYTTWGRRGISLEVGVIILFDQEVLDTR